ncbi:MAG: serpin family protein [Faecalimonas sp.]|nr:serpin family protein [Faecalimonas sp.]
MNRYLCAYQTALSDTKKCRLHMANSIWMKDMEGFSVEKTFLQTNADYYGAQVYQAAFDQQTVKDINRWVDKHTDGMIQSLLEKPIDKDVVMYLINALAFDAEWQSIYKKNQVREGVFTREDGQAQSVKLMYSEEYTYLEDEMATGFLKYYADNEYAFVALLPKEDVKVSEYVSWLTADHLSSLLNEPMDISVRTAIPQFSYEDSMNMGAALQQMGMTDAFDENKADFSGIDGTEYGKLVINRVLHKTRITVDERGTKAGAVTAVEMKEKSAITEENKRVYLDRPFLYMIIDCETKSPLFMGTMMK